MEIQSRLTNAERLARMATDPVYFARAIGVDYDPRPSQIALLRAPLERLTAITSKRRQIGASTTLAIWIAWSMFCKRSGWKAFVVAPNEFQSGNILSMVYQCFDSTPLLRDNLTAGRCRKNDTTFALTKNGTLCEVLLVGESGGKSRVGGSIKDNNGILLYEEYGDIPKSREVTLHLNPMTAWGGGVIYCGTKAGFSGSFFEKWKYIREREKQGNPRYRVFHFPLIEFIAERHGGKGISVEWLRERKAEEPRHIWLREYMGRFAESADAWFGEDAITRAWQIHQNEQVTRNPQFPLLLSIDWGMRDATAFIFAQDNYILDRLEVVRIVTFRKHEHADKVNRDRQEQYYDIGVNNYDDVVRALCKMRERGYEPEVVYCDKNNKGGVYSEQLEHVHSFAVEDASWSTNTYKTQALRSLRNLIHAGRFIFPRDQRLLDEFSRFSPKEDPETGKYKFKDHWDDCISAMAMLAHEYMSREMQPPIISASLGARQLDNESNYTDKYSFAF